MSDKSTFSTMALPSPGDSPIFTGPNPATPKESFVDISVCRRAIIARTQSLVL